MSATAAGRADLPRLDDRLALGSEGLRVSPFCLGMVGDPAVVSAAFDAGVNFFFLTTDMHWPLYEHSRRGVADLLARGKGMRDRVVVAAVCYPTQPEFCTAPFEELVAAVPGLERIDVLLAGGAYGTEFGRRLPVYRDHRQERFLGNRAIGATFHDRVAAVAALKERQVDLAYIRYNPDHSGAREDVFPHVAARPRPPLFNFKSTFGYVPPARMAEIGLPGPEYWNPDITDHYRFALTRPEMDGLLVGFRKPAEVAALAAAVERGPLTDEEEAYMMDVASVARGDAQVAEDP